MRFVSFAQNFEDVMLFRALGNVKDGFYVDVGAWSPEIDSVTKAFYDRGWNGINVEPNPDYAAELGVARPRDINLQIAIADVDGATDFHVIRPSMGLSTLDQAIAKQHAAHGYGVSTSMPVATRTLASVCAEYIRPKQDIHFLKIDVEGAETAVIRGADWARYRPWVVIVEATRPLSTIETQAAWEPMLLAAGYMLVYRDGINRFYVANEHAELAVAFTHPPNVFDNFESAAQQRLEAHVAILSTRANIAQATIDQLTSKVTAMEANIFWRLTRLLQSIAREVWRGMEAGAAFIWRLPQTLASAVRLYEKPHTLTPQAHRIYKALQTAIARRRAS